LSRLHFKEKGNGLAVILLHGFCETHEVWNLVADRLALNFRTISVDLPGFGRSILPPPNSIDDAAALVIDFIVEDLDLDQCVVLGHSLGGYVALSMVEKNPELFSAVGLIHSTAFADSDERKIARGKVIEFVINHGVKPFIESFIPPLFHDQMSPHILSTVALASKTNKQTLIGYTEAMRIRPDRIHVLKGYEKPTLFVAGRLDTVIPVKAICDQSSYSRNPSLTVLEGVAHMGMLENEELTAKVIGQFLSDLS